MVTLFEAGWNKSSKIEGDIGDDDDVKHPKSKVKGREFTCPNLALEEKKNWYIGLVAKASKMKGYQKLHVMLTWCWCQSKSTQNHRWCCWNDVDTKSPPKLKDCSKYLWWKKKD